MKKILMGLVAAATLAGFVAPAFAEDAPPAAAEGEKKAKKGKKGKKAEEKPAEGGAAGEKK